MSDGTEAINNEKVSAKEMEVPAKHSKWHFKNIVFLYIYSYEHQERRQH